MQAERAMWLGSAVLLLGCASFKDDLRRAEAAYADARYEDAEQWTRALAERVAGFAPGERAQYFFVAGMTHLRLGDAVRARHELGLCAAQAELTPGVLAKPAEELLMRTLGELARP